MSTRHSKSDRSRELCASGLMRPAEAAAFLGVSRSLIYDLMASGDIPYVRVRSDRRVPRTALIEYASKRIVERAH